MEALRAVAALNLPDGWIAAGFVRNLVWDSLHAYPSMTPLNDVDVIYYDAANIDKAAEKLYEEKLRANLPEIPWSVKNQARMHIKNGDPPYSSIEEALMNWCETPTAVGARIDTEGKIELIAPLGIADLVDGVCRPTPLTLGKPEKINEYRERVKSKRWAETWPLLKIS
ncbi:MAG: nucleotidyltransferase family protein [Proteobacteria bacterium]|nr:nucleotidyltransferase family protein [Pseudomonadota bacterium]